MKKWQIVVLCLLFTLVTGSSPYARAQAISFDDALVDAADNQAIATVSQLLRSAYPVDSKGKFGVTALMRAAYHGNDRIADLLLGVGANVNAVDVGGATALHLASREGHVSVVNLLLKREAFVDMVDAEGWTPLMRASLANKPEIVETLLKAGADVNAANESGETPLMQAIHKRNLDVAKILLSHGADPAHINRSGFSVLDLAKRKRNEKLVELVEAALKGSDAPSGEKPKKPAFALEVKEAPKPVEFAEDAKRKPVENKTILERMEAVLNPDAAQKLAEKDKAEALALAKKQAQKTTSPAPSPSPTAGTTPASMAKADHVVTEKIPGATPPETPKNAKILKDTPWQASASASTAAVTDKKSALSKGEKTLVSRLTKESGSASETKETPNSAKTTTQKSPAKPIASTLPIPIIRPYTPSEEDTPWLDDSGQPDLAQRLQQLATPLSMVKKPPAAVALKTKAEETTTEIAENSEEPDESAEEKAEVTEEKPKEQERAELQPPPPTPPVTPASAKILEANVLPWITPAPSQSAPAKPLETASAVSKSPAPVTTPIPKPPTPVVAKTPEIVAEVKDTPWTTPKELSPKTPQRLAVSDSTDQLEDELEQVVIKKPLGVLPAAPSPVALESTTQGGGPGVTSLPEIDFEIPPDTSPKQAKILDLANVSDTEQVREVPIHTNAPEAPASSAPPLTPTPAPAPAKVSTPAPTKTAASTPPARVTSSALPPNAASAPPPAAKKIITRSSEPVIDPVIPERPPALASATNAATLSRQDKYERNNEEEENEAADDDAEPFETGISRAGVTEGTVEVAEAIRVPLTAPKQVSLESDPRSEGNINQLHRDFSPSGREKPDTYWIEIRRFQSEEAAVGHFESVTVRDDLYLRMRIISPADSRRNNGYALRVGTFNNNKDAADACLAFGTEAGLQCAIIRDLGKSTPASTAHGPRFGFERSHYQNEYAYQSDGLTQLFWVQLGTYANEFDAIAYWQRLRADNIDVLDPLKVSLVTPKHSSGSTQSIRLRAGPFQAKADANATCRRLKTREISCLAVAGK